MIKHFLYLNEFGDALLVRHEDDSTLRALQTMVEGYVECVRTDPTETNFSADMWVNEEGLYQPDLTINPLASAFAGQRIVGPAIIACSNEEGETIGLTDSNLAAITHKGLMIDDNDGAGYTPDEVVAMRAQIVRPQ